MTQGLPYPICVHEQWVCTNASVVWCTSDGISVVGLSVSHWRLFVKREWDDEEEEGQQGAFGPGRI